MRIALAQTSAAKADITANVARHVAFAQLAASNDADLVVFPELSLTGYWPQLAVDVGLAPDDARLDPLQRASDEHAIEIVVGLPVATTTKPTISLAILGQRSAPRLYAKQHLHADEEPYFTAGEPCVGVIGDDPRIGLAICYEISVAAHATATFAAGALLYLASVAKTADAIAGSYDRLSAVAREYDAPVLMVNCVGPTGDGDGAGRSAIWDRDGRLQASLDDTVEALLLFDTVNAEATIVPA